MACDNVSLQLYFDGTRELDGVREGALDIACAVLELDPRPSLVEREREPLRHPQSGGDSHTYRIRYDDGGELSLVQQVEHGSGNPRDGYGYHMDWELRVAERLLVKVGEADWGPRPKFFSATMIGPGLGVDTIDRARVPLRARFGADNDRCDALWIAVGNARTLSDHGDKDGARTLLARADWDGGQTHGWAERATKLCRRLGIKAGGAG